MKRIVSICLTICLILSGVMFTAVNAEMKSSDIADRAGLLKAIGVIDKIDDETEGNREISRAEFAVLVGKILNVQSKDESERYFTDVPMDHWGVSYINSLAQMGVVSVPSDRLFRPNDKITRDEAVKMVISGMGYSGLAQVKGGYPLGYSSVAKTLDFTITGGGDAMTVYSSYIVIYDALRAETYEMKSIENGFSDYDVSDETLLSINFDVYEVKGTVVQAAGIAADGELSKGDDNEETKRIVRIDNEEYVTDIDFSDFIARKVRVYYRQLDKDADKEIIYNENYSRKESVIDIAAKDFIGYGDGKLEYAVGDKNKKTDIPVGAFIIKNGAQVRENVADAMNISRGRIRVIDIENDGVVDVVLVWEYKNIFTQSVNENEYVLYDTVFDGNTANLDPREKMVYITDASGNMKSFGDIAVGQLISVYESADYAKAVICGDGVTALIYGLAADKGGSQRAQIGKSESDKQWYDFDEEYYDDYLKGKYYTKSDSTTDYSGDMNLPIGATVTYYKDAEGYIAYMTGLEGTDWKYGYLVNLSKDAGTLEDVTRLKLFTQLGTMTKFECADKVEIDGIKRTNYAEIAAGLTKAEKLRSGEDNILGQLVRYKTNSKGKINKIDTRNYNSEKEDRMSLHHTASKDNLTFWYHPQCFNGGVCYYTGSTVKFVVPTHADLATAQEEDFRLLKGFEDYVSYTFDAYRIDPKGATEDAMVFFGNPGSNNAKGPYLVNDIYEEADSEGTVRLKAEVYNVESTDLLSLSASDSFDFTTADGERVEKGDIVYVKMDSSGKVKELTMYCDYSTFGTENEPKAGWKNVSSPRQSDSVTDLICAQLKSVNNSIYRLKYSSPLTESDMTIDNYNDCDYMTRCDIKSTLIFDGTNVRKGTSADLVAATHSGAAKAEKYWFAIRLARIKGAVIYE